MNVSEVWEITLALTTAASALMRDGRGDPAVVKEFSKTVVALTRDLNGQDARMIMISLAELAAESIEVIAETRDEETTSQSLLQAMGISLAQAVIADEKN